MKLGTLNFLILEWYMSLRNTLVPHFGTDLYTRTKLVFQKGDTRPTLVCYLLVLIIPQVGQG
jgi:hypothetical protein